MKIEFSIVLKKDTKMAEDKDKKSNGNGSGKTTKIRTGGK
jgi:hypothetical protein